MSTPHASCSRFFSLPAPQLFPNPIQCHPKEAVDSRNPVSTAHVIAVRVRHPRNELKSLKTRLTDSESEVRRLTSAVENLTRLSEANTAHLQNTREYLDRCTTIMTNGLERITALVEVALTNKADKVVEPAVYIS